MKSTLRGMGLALVLAFPTVLSSPSANAQVNTARSIEAFQQVRQHFPAIVSELEAGCNDNQWLQQKLDDQNKRLYFTCWDAPEPSGSRNGSYLGALPLSPTDQTFMTSRLACAEEDEACQKVSERLRVQFPEELKAAEFKCSMREGTVLFSRDH
ncbi:MAG: hypothetical protein AAF329_29130, partial [Cyanobacteria bacterium P01_A01_bin.17]